MKRSSKSTTTTILTIALLVLATTQASLAAPRKSSSYSQQSGTPAQSSSPAPSNAGDDVSDADRIAFLKKFKTSQFNTNSVVPIDAPELAVPRRRSAEEGCKELGNGFICFDLVRNIRCVNGQVTENQVRPFDANFNLKACINDVAKDIPAFCAGGASANPCVARAEDAVAALRAGKEFFLEPKKTGKETVKAPDANANTGKEQQQSGKGNGNNNNNNTPPPPATTSAAPPAATDPPTLEPKLKAAVKDGSFCDKNFPNLPLSNGTQIRAGACSQTVQGALPSVDNMVSTLIVAPANGATLKANQPFTVSIRNRNIATGFFDDPQLQYYATPQTLNGQGIIEGHQHITVQNIGDAKNPPDAKLFAFFKGLNAPAVDGVLSVTFTPDDKKPFPPGNYRICSITGTFGHQPVVMPVAQR
ncbi:hypothetical protein HDU96_000843, partial [Phlyctochytrium bullatum]